LTGSRTQELTGLQRPHAHNDCPGDFTTGAGLRRITSGSYVDGLKAVNETREFQDNNPVDVGLLTPPDTTTSPPKQSRQLKQLARTKLVRIRIVLKRLINILKPSFIK